MLSLTWGQNSNYLFGHTYYGGTTFWKQANQTYTHFPLHFPKLEENSSCWNHMKINFMHNWVNSLFSTFQQPQRLLPTPDFSVRTQHGKVPRVYPSSVLQGNTAPSLEQEGQPRAGWEGEGALQKCRVAFRWEQRGQRPSLTPSEKEAWFIARTVLLSCWNSTASSVPLSKNMVLSTDCVTNSLGLKIEKFL